MGDWLGAVSPFLFPPSKRTSAPTMYFVGGSGRGGTVRFSHLLGRSGQGFRSAAAAGRAASSPTGTLQRHSRPPLRRQGAGRPSGPRSTQADASSPVRRGATQSRDGAAFAPGLSSGGLRVTASGGSQRPNHGCERRSERRSGPPLLHWKALLPQGFRRSRPNRRTGTCAPVATEMATRDDRGAGGDPHPFSSFTPRDPREKTGGARRDRL